MNREVKIKNLPFVNVKIRAPRVKLIDENRQVLGEFDTHTALRIARERGFDLVEVGPDSIPPICRLMNFGRYVYEKKRQERESRKHQHQAKIREIHLSLKISEHDFQVKQAKVKEFLTEGDRVKIKLRLRGRELLHADLGMKVVEKVITNLAEIGKPESPAKQEEQTIYVTLIPQKRSK